MTEFRILAQTTVHRWDALGQYDVTSDTAKKIVLTFDRDRAGHDFEPEREPWKVVMTIKGGEVVRTTYHDRSGDILARITGTDTDAGLIRHMLDPDVDRGWDIYQVLLQGGATFQGNPKANWPEGVNDITTSLFDDVVRTNDGNSYVKDRGGADLYIGGDNFDTLTYDEWFGRDPARALQGIEADLAAGSVIGPDGETDTLRGQWEGINGTFLGDVMRGNGADNEFQGFLGSDLIDGRAGSDRVSYRDEVWMGAERGVTVNLQKGFAKDSFGDRDRLISIERAEGTDVRDRFVDDNGQDNTYQGRAGNDVFLMKGGDDNIEGGEGADRFVFKGTAFGYDDIRDFDPFEGDRIRFTAADSRADLNDIFVDDRGNTIIRMNDGAIVELQDFDVDELGVNLNDYILY